MLGDLIAENINSKTIARSVAWRAHQTNIPKKILYEWLLAYFEKGREGLTPQEWVGLWNTWSEAKRKVVIDRYNAISIPVSYGHSFINLAEDEIIPED